LKASHDPCVAGVTIASRHGTYEVEPEVGAPLIECFGFVPVVEAVSMVFARGKSRAAAAGQCAKVSATTTESACSMAPRWAQRLNCPECLAS
jgi:hypothetical protein